MTRKLKFYGASDDLFEIEGHKKGEPDEIGCYDEPCAVRISTPSEGLIIVGNYNGGQNMPGTWAMGISQVEEDVPLPSWPITFTSKGYSIILEIEVPDDAKIAHVTHGKD